MNCTASFCIDLYWSEVPDYPDVGQVFHRGLPKVSPEKYEQLEAPLSLNDLHVNLKSLQNGRTARIDGLPVDYCKCLYFVRGEDLLYVFKDNLDCGRLPPSCTTVVIPLLT